MAEWIETLKGAVLASEYDSESHMNSQIYVARFDQATWFLLHSIGITPRAIKKAGRRIAVVRQGYQFVKEIKGGELVVIESGFVAHAVEEAEELAPDRGRGEPRDRPVRGPPQAPARARRGTARDRERGGAVEDGVILRDARFASSSG